MNNIQPSSLAQESKLTDWANEPTLVAVKEDLEHSKPFHDAHVSNVRRWNNLMEIKGEAAPVKVKGRSSVQPKLVRRQAEWRYSALSEPFLGTQKLFQVNPVTHEDGKAARQNETLLNWQFRTKLNKIKFIDDYVRSAVDDGTVIVRTGWKRETTTVKKEVPVFEHYELQDEESLQQFQQALESSSNDPRTFNETAPPELKAAIDYYNESGLATMAVVAGTEIVPEEKILINQPTVDVINPVNVSIDPSCGGDLKKALYVIISFEPNKADLLKEPKKYKKERVEAIDWSGSTVANVPDHESTTPEDFRMNDTMRKRIVAYEYWGYYDISGKGVLEPIVCTWVGNVMIRMERSPFQHGFPFVLVPYSPVKRSLYGQPDAELLEDNQKILGAVTRGMIDLMGRSANGQQGFAKGMLDPLNRRRYENGQDYEFNPNVHPSNGIIEHKFPEIPQSALTMLTLQNQEAEALTGVKSFSGGISGEAYGKVATGIRGALDAASKREMSILRRLAKGMVDIGTQIIAMNAEFLSPKEVIRVTNTEFVEILREDLPGNFDLEVDISTAEVDNAKSEDLAFMLQTLGNNMGQEITLMLLAEIARLKRMPELAHRLETYQPPPPSPEQQEMARLELLKLQKEIEQMDSVIALNNAKAAEATSKKDKTDLDYVEQETGTAHEREMQKQRAQSQGNQNLQVTKALTTPRKEGEKAPDLEAAIGFNQISDRLTDGSMVDPRIPN